MNLSDVAFWYLAQTKPRQEDIACLHLQRQSYRVRLPKIKSLRAKKLDRSATPLDVLFPGYIFFAPNRPEQSIAPVRSTLGISRLVRFGSEPAKITNQLLEDILAFVDQTNQSPGGLLAHLNKIGQGTSVLVTDGPFSGLTGLVSWVASDRVMVLLEIMGKVQTLGFDLGQLDKA